MGLSWDPEFAEAAASYIESMAAAPKPALHDVQARRDGVEGLFKEILKSFPDHSEVKVEHFEVPVTDQRKIRMFRFWTTNYKEVGPAILYVHGGGMICGDIENMYAKTLKMYAVETGMQIFAPEYGVAPENPHPGPTEDVFAGLKWLNEHAETYNVDTARIAIQGDSAGGGIAAGVALMARDRGLSPPLAKQILHYPMLDDTNVGKQDAALEPFLLLWNEIDNRTGWAALLGDESVGTNDISPYAAPARVADARNLPPTYLDLGELDLFAKEGLQYALKLLQANVQLECHVYAGVPHAWELLAPKIAVSQQAMKNRLNAMRSF